MSPGSTSTCVGLKMSRAPYLLKQPLMPLIDRNLIASSIWTDEPDERLLGWLGLSDPPTRHLFREQIGP